MNNGGEFDVNFKAGHDIDCNLVFQNAPVAMPIVSTHGWNAMGFRTVTDEDFGLTIHKASGEKDPLLVQNGVYFMKMRVARTLTCKPTAPIPTARTPKDSVLQPPPQPVGERPPRETQPGGAAPGP